MVVKLAPARPDDRYIRMYYKLVNKSEGDSYWVEAEVVPEDEASDETGWIEFWANDAKACKDALKRINGRLYVLEERKQKRKKELSDDKAADEVEEYFSLLSDGIAHRSKAWNLVDSEGKHLEAPHTFENAKSVFSDDDHNLLEVSRNFLEGRRNFPLRASGS